MTNPTNPDTSIPSELVDRLRAHNILKEDQYSKTVIRRNPDGEEAASLILTQEANIKELVEALRRLADEAEARHCEHEDTHRGGSIWTICDGCGAKWADDEGGFVPYSTPDYIVRARSVLSRNGGGK